MNNKKSFISKYNKANYKMYQFRVRKDNEDLIEYLDNIDKRNSYLVNLIKKDKDVLTIKQIKQSILPILSKYNIHEVYLFGSYSRGEARSDSDVDIYCEKGNIKTLIDQSGLLIELKEALRKEVDLVLTTNNIDDYFREQLEEDKIRLC